MPVALNTISAELLFIFDIEAMVRNGGLLVMFLIIYGTTGLFFCFFLPSGAVLFTAGIFAATGALGYDIFIITSVLVVASILGNLTGYWVGRKAGPMLYKRENSRFFKKRHLTTAETFYSKYGWMALTLGLYLPIIRTFASTVAGIVRLSLQRFILLVSVGSLVWVTSFVAAGYFIGSRPYLKPWIKYIVIFFILAVTIPLIIKYGREWKRMGRRVK